MILPQAQGVMNLASRVPGQSARRLGDDMRKVHGRPVLLAVTFVDPSRFTGACFRAANWQPLGRTEGFARNPGAPVTWTAHGQPKEIFVYPLVHDAREQLRALDDAPHWRSEGDPAPLTANRLGSLFECPSTIAEFRSRRGRRYPSPTVVAIAAAAKLAGYHGVTAFAEFAQALSQEQLRALRAYYSHRLQRFTAPTVTTFHNILVTLDALHTQVHTQVRTARHVVEHCRAHYVITAVKLNRLDLLADLAALDWERPEVRATEHRTNDQRHGRRETRTCRVTELSTESHASKLPHRRVALRIERERKHRKTGVVQHETVHGLTAVPFEQASAARGGTASPEASRWPRLVCAACSSAWASCPSAAVPGASATR